MLDNVERDDSIEAPFSEAFANREKTILSYEWGWLELEPCRA